MKTKRHNPPKGVIEAMKKASREEYGFIPTKIFRNKKKYRREKSNNQRFNEKDLDF